MASEARDKVVAHCPTCSVRAEAEVVGPVIGIATEEQIEESAVICVYERAGGRL